MIPPSRSMTFDRRADSRRRPYCTCEISVPPTCRPSSKVSLHETLDLNESRDAQHAGSSPIPLRLPRVATVPTRNSARRAARPPSPPRKRRRSPSPRRRPAPATHPRAVRAVRGPHCRPNAHRRAVDPDADTRRSAVTRCRQEATAAGLDASAFGRVIVGTEGNELLQFLLL